MDFFIGIGGYERLYVTNSGHFSCSHALVCVFFARATDGNDRSVLADGSQKCG